MQFGVAKPSIDKFRKSISSWYTNNRRCFPWRLKSANNYQKIISEVLLQRTRVDTVVAFYPAFMKKYPSWKKLSLAPQKDLQKILKPIGLWRQKAISLKKLSREMTLRRGRFPKSREELEALPGVGQYIANAVLSICHDQPEPLLDSNMARVLERYFGPRKLADIRYDQYLQKLSKNILPKKNSIEFNWAVLDFSMLICKLKKPLCNMCPLSEKCNYFFMK